MNFQSVEIENFGTIGRVKLPLSNRGLILVTGKNNDAAKANSNGAGKSLLLDAFCWCIWGKTVREDKDDAVVNTRVGKNCRVQVLFSDDAGTFQVTRYRKHEESTKPNDLTVFLGDVNISDDSMKATQTKIHEIMGLTFDTFCALMPGAGKNAAQMTDSVIKELLENMLQITALAKAGKGTERRLKKLRPQLHSLVHKISSLDEQIAKDQTRLAAYVQESEKFADTQTVEVCTLTQTLPAQEAAIVAAETQLGVRKTAVAKLAKLAKTRLQVCDRHSLHRTSMSQIQKQGDIDLRQYVVREAELTTELRISRKAHARIDSLTSECESCVQPIPSTHKTQQLHEKADVIRELQAALIDLKIARDLTRTKLDEKLATPQENITKCELEFFTLDAEVATLNTTVQIGEEAAGRLPELRKAKNSTLVRIKEVKTRESPYAAWIVVTEAELNTAEQDREVSKSELVELQKLEQKLEFWKHAFSASGIRSFILNNVTPILNARADHYCDLLTDGEMKVDFSTQTTLQNGETREKFSINIAQAHGGSSYRSNSTGEKQRANLAVCFALSDLAEMHSQKRIDFRFLDEPFEGIDESGTEAVVAVLNEQRAKYPTVFVVTHQNHFKDVFPTEITMIKNNGMSRLEEMNAPADDL